MSAAAVRIQGWLGRSMLLAVCLCMLLALATARADDFAQREPEAVAWEALSSDQQQLLGRFEHDWTQIPAGRQQALARGSERYLAMTPEQRERARGRFQRWQELPDSTKIRVRNRWQQFQNMSPTERDAVRRGFQQFRRLPVDTRRELLERWRDASPIQRRQMMENLRRERMRRAQPGAPRVQPPPPR